MKDLLIKLMSVILIAAFLAAFAACGGSGSITPTEAPTEAPSSVPTEAPTEAPTAEPVDDVAEKVLQYSVYVQPQIRQAAASVAQVMGLDCYAEGRDLVVEYSYVNKYGGDAATLRTSIGSADESFRDMYEGLVSFTGSDEVRLVLRYLNSDGSKILDYVIDKNYVFGGSGYQTTYASLEDFVDSEAFQSTVSANDQAGVFKTSAFVENGNVIVIEQKLLQAFSAEDLADLRSTWDEGMAQNGDYSAQILVSTIRMAVDIDGEIGLVFRLVDKNCELISSYTANVG